MKLKRVDIARNWAGTSVAFVCLLSSVVGQEPAENSDDSSESSPVVEVESPDDQNATPEQSDADVLARAPQMEIEQLQEMVQVFRRLGNTKMAGALSKILLTKDPDNAVGKADESAAVTSGAEEVEPDPPSEVDRKITRAENAVAAGRHAEAVGILRRLKVADFSGGSFPYQQDLAYALLESGQVDAAAVAFRELVDDQAQPREDRADAEARVIEIRIRIEGKRAMLLLAEDKQEEAIALADGILKIYPTNQAAQGLNAEVLGKSGRHKKAAALLRDVKRQSGAGPFEFQQQLAYAVFESEGRAASEPFFRELSNESYPIEQRRDALERLRDFQIERLYERGLKAIEKGDAAGGLRIANRLMQAKPSPNEAYELKALALKAQREYAAAVQLLEQYKSTRFGDKPFPMAGDLADCYAGAGDFIKARQTYEEILNVPADAQGTDLDDAKQGLEELAPITNPSIAAYSEFFTEDEGDMFRAEVDGRTGMMGPHQFSIRAHRDEMDIEDSFLESGSYDRWDAVATYTATLPNRYFADLTGGGSEDEFLYGAGVGRRAWDGGLGWKLYYAGNERATDSLTLEALDGRQDAAHFDMEANFSRGWNFDGRFNYRQVKVDGIDIGDGFGGELQFGKILREVSSTTGGVYIGYHGEFTDFNHASPSASELRTITGANDPVILPAIDIVGSLVEERINRHEIEVVLDRQITPRIAAAVVGGFGWEFEDEEFVYRAGLNLSYKLRDNVIIQAALDYDSSGSSTNSGSEVIFASILLRIFF